MDDATPPDSLIASSSSGITPSVMQSKCKRPSASSSDTRSIRRLIPLVGLSVAPEASPAALLKR